MHPNQYPFISIENVHAEMASSSSVVFIVLSLRNEVAILDCLKAGVAQK